MNWIHLQTLQQLKELNEQSHNNIVLIFKHSTRCATSRMTLDRLERNWNTEEMRTITPYFLDLISYREVSNQIAHHFGIVHESPQVLVISKGEAILDLSHFQIDYNLIRESVKN
jgi:bacillithiol system protein YtxJ